MPSTSIQQCISPAKQLEIELLIPSTFKSAKGLTSLSHSLLAYIYFPNCWTNSWINHPLSQIASLIMTHKSAKELRCYPVDQEASYSLRVWSTQPSASRPACWVAHISQHPNESIVETVYMSYGREFQKQWCYCFNFEIWLKFLLLVDDYLNAKHVSNFTLLSSLP